MMALEQGCQLLDCCRAHSAWLWRSQLTRHEKRLPLCNCHVPTITPPSKEGLPCAFRSLMSLQERAFSVSLTPQTETTTSPNFMWIAQTLASIMNASVWHVSHIASWPCHAILYKNTCNVWRSMLAQESSWIFDMGHQLPPDPTMHSYIRTHAMYEGHCEQIYCLVMWEGNAILCENILKYVKVLCMNPLHVWGWPSLSFNDLVCGTLCCWCSCGCTRALTYSLILGTSALNMFWLIIVERLIMSWESMSWFLEPALNWTDWCN